MCVCVCECSSVRVRMFELSSVFWCALNSNSSNTGCLQTLYACRCVRVRVCVCECVTFTLRTQRIHPHTCVSRTDRKFRPIRRVQSCSRLQPIACNCQSKRLNLATIQSSHNFPRCTRARFYGRPRTCQRQPAPISMTLFGQAFMTFTWRKRRQ